MNDQNYNAYPMRNNAIFSYFEKNRKVVLLLVAVLAIFIVLLSQSIYIVNEAEEAVVSRFGVIQAIIINDDNNFHEQFKNELRDEITLSGSVAILRGSGLRFKLPFVDRAY